MQQYLPFTVLKRCGNEPLTVAERIFVATVLTVYGIETYCLLNDINDSKDIVATVLTVYGIETHIGSWFNAIMLLVCCNSTYRLR